MHVEDFDGEVTSYGSRDHVKGGFRYRLRGVCGHRVERPIFQADSRLTSSHHARKITAAIGRKAGRVEIESARPAAAGLGPDE